MIHVQKYQKILAFARMSWDISFQPLLNSVTGYTCCVGKTTVPLSLFLVQAWLSSNGKLALNKHTHWFSLCSLSNFPVLLLFVWDFNVMRLHWHVEDIDVQKSLRFVFVVLFDVKMFALICGAILDVIVYQMLVFSSNVWNRIMCWEDQKRRQ